jgi:hypothetical protein
MKILNLNSSLHSINKIANTMTLEEGFVRFINIALKKQIGIEVLV